MGISELPQQNILSRTPTLTNILFMGYPLANYQWGLKSFKGDFFIITEAQRQ